MNKQIHIMLVEDHAGYRETIAIALEQSDNMQLGSQFGTAEIALRALQNTASPKQPDVILLDLNLPGMSGIEALPWIKQYAPDSEVIILTQSDNAADVTRAITEGAAGYLLKSATFKEITEGIQTVNQTRAMLLAVLRHIYTCRFLIRSGLAGVRCSSGTPSASSVIFESERAGQK